MIRVAIAGATGWAGSALARAVVAAPDLELVGAVARRDSGRPIGDVLGLATPGPVIAPTVEAALGERTDVFVEYTKPEAAKANALAALARGAHVVIGTSGLTDAELEEIGRAATAAARGALACGNFALTAVLLLRFADLAARHLPHWEITDFAPLEKLDAPSGTARELASRLAKHRTAPVAPPPADQPSRGGVLAGSPVHSVRLPGYVHSVDVTFGLPGQRLSLRHDAGESAEPYVGGALLAIRKVSSLTGLHRGLEAVLEL